MRLRNVKNKEEILNNSSYLVKNPMDNKGKWNKVFNNSNPIYIEIGMGKGKFIIENAIKYPNINFIGIEKFDSVLAKSLPKIPEGLNNLLIIRLDALNIDTIFDKEIDRIYLNFSDPWPKKRHTKRRLTYKDFLENYKKVLKKDGIIEFKTDNRGLFEYSLVSMQNFGMEFIEVYLDLHKTEVFNVETEYEKKFSPFGPIYKLVAKF